MTLETHIQTPCTQTISYKRGLSGALRDALVPDLTLRYIRREKKRTDTTPPQDRERSLLGEDMSGRSMDLGKRIAIDLGRIAVYGSIVGTAIYKLLT